jgi:hypothetical protein
MKGEARPSDNDLWGKIANRLTSLPENSEFMRKLVKATGLLSDHPPEYGSKRLQRRHVSRDAHRPNSTTHTAPAYPNSLRLEIQYVSILRLRLEF